MSNHPRVLPAQSLGGVFRLVSRIETEIPTKDASAIDLLMDFTHQNPLIIHSTTGIQDAKNKLTLIDARFCVVVNRNDEVVGILALKDLIGPWPMSLASQRGTSMAEITAQDVMRPIWSMPAVRQSDLQALRVDELVSAFEEIHSDYILVTDTGPGNERLISGLLSADDVGERLGVHLSPNPRPESFSDIVHAVRKNSG